MNHRSSFVVLTMLLLGLSSAGILSSCNKEESYPGVPPPSGGHATLSDEDSLKYLMYHIMQVSFDQGGRDSDHQLPTYYWYTQVPDLDPLNAPYATAEDLLNAMSSYPVNPQGNPFDRYSFLDRTGAIAENIQSGVVEGATSDLGSQGYFGMEVAYTADAQHLVVLYADQNSPAGKKGIQRGWEIAAVNGDRNIGYDGPTGVNVMRVSKAIYNSSSVTLTFKKQNRTTVTYTLDKTSYELNPLLFDTTYIRHNKKIGYFALYTFPSVYDNNGTPTLTRQILDQLFAKFQAEKITELIVDLRYNGGGAVSTAEYLDSAIAPAKADGQIMYQYLYNDKLTASAGLLGLDKNVYFRGTGGLNLDHVFFIVGRSTASASELTLNNLKPYMNVQLVGDTTYGKPVGFIDFTISDYDSTGKENYLADLYAINFETRNARGQGSYFEGIPPDTKAGDNVGLNWGDPGDDHLATIFQYLYTGSFTPQSTFARTMAQQKATLIFPGSVPSPRFNGMVDYRLSKQWRAGIQKNARP